MCSKVRGTSSRVHTRALTAEAMGALTRAAAATRAPAASARVGVSGSGEPSPVEESVTTVGSKGETAEDRSSEARSSAMGSKGEEGDADAEERGDGDGDKRRQ